MRFEVKKENLSEWYSEILEAAKIVDIRYPVKGMPVYLKNGYIALRNILRKLEEFLDKTNHYPLAFPVVIPYSILKKETEHIKGFEGEVFWVDRGGYEKLEEPLALRPTSETPMYYMFSLWIRSKSDLPLKTYQTNQVYRYETKQTKPLIRGREIYWNEAHTAHESKEDALKQIVQSIEIYEKLFKELGIPFYWFKRPEWDKFAGAEFTIAADAIMPDGRFLQIATTHLLGQRFSKVYDIKFLDKNNEWKYVWQTSYGISMRVLGAIIMVHGDDQGLKWPSFIAPTQISIIPIYNKENKEKILKIAEEVYKKLSKKYRVFLDIRDERPGWKFNDSELNGIPLRIEIGQKDLNEGKFTIFIRGDNSKDKYSLDLLESEEILELAEKLLEKNDRALLEKARKEFEERLFIIKDFNNFSINNLIKIIKEKKIIKMPFCGNKECAKKLKEEVEGIDCRGVIINKSFEEVEKEEVKGKKCICGKEAENYYYFGKSY